MSQRDPVVGGNSAEAGIARDGCYVVVGRACLRCFIECFRLIVLSLYWPMVPRGDEFVSCLLADLQRGEFAMTDGR